MTLGGQTLPEPYAYVVERDYRGGIQITASGALVEDVVSGTNKQTWTISFRNVTAAERSAIEIAFSSIVGSAYTFVDLEGNSHSVTRSDTHRTLVWEYSRVAGSIRYATTLVLREV